MNTTEQILPDGPWLDRLNPDYLAAAYPAWAIGDGGFEAAAVAFRRHGLAVLAPLDFGLRFEPAYYREIAPAWEGATDADCYRHYLLEGLAAGQPGSAAAHLAGLGLPSHAYPAAFPWQYYARLRPSTGAHRWAALDDFCDTGFRDFGETWPFGPEAFDFLIALGQKFSTIHDAMAIRAYELAQSHRPLPAADQQHLADAYLRQRLWRPALQLYDAIIRAGAPNGWTVRNFVKCASQLENWPVLLEGLEFARQRQSGDPLWGYAVDEAVSALFNARQRAARLLMAQAAYEQADGHLAGMVEETAGVIEKLRSSTPARGTKTRPVMLLANQDDTESAARFVIEKSRLLDLSGIPHEVHDYAAAPALTERLAGARALILFRAPALPPVIQAVLAARRLGIPVFYESDVSLPESQAAPAEAAFGGMIPQGEYDDFRYGLALQRAAARLCDYAIAPTERLVTALRPLTRSRRGFVLPNSLLPDGGPAANPRPGGRVEIFLRAHRATCLDATAGSAGRLLLDILQRWPEPVLRVSGPVQFAPCFDLHAGRLFHAGAAAVPADYWPALAAAGVNVCLGGEGAEDEYHAELGWREAACVAVPSLLLIPDGRLTALRDGANAMRGATTEAMFPAFERLLGDAALRRGVGARAARDAALLEGPEAAAQILATLLAEAAAFKDGHARYP